ncbi:MAG: FABP family protein [Actinomycetota bacterium]|nr:FABP family protein [Actinomycetota bacterium]
MTADRLTHLPADLAPQLVPLGWLLGTWRGVGVGGAPESGDYRFGQEVTFSSDGRDFLAYDSRTWLLDDEGNEVRPHEREAGYWRPAAQGPGEEARPAGVELEVVLASERGVVEIYVGRAEGARIELSTDVVARTASAEPYAAGHRLYGQVEGDLLYAYDSAPGETPLRPHLSARLRRS